ncbi:MAG: bifunctional DNA-formamidopyrimidine glycosylase/DNA-(apurinic or apyrimidinic site) lyase [Gammaproteobacteria bacterium]|nr:bifunctional DNA-formamidopyrimidine glycosylase/DNA-(apurinic or apyrimidinic site) lyase [Gammaproteobacteria bacterium]
MPELPEVETTRRGVSPHIKGELVTGVIVRERRLRWPVPKDLAKTLLEQPLLDVERRAKYLLFRFQRGTLLLHLGMSGHLRVIPADTPVEKHDHLDIVFGNGQCLRFNDPRRFGSVHWTAREPLEHPLLEALGPEPLEDAFDGELLFARSRKRKLAVKLFIMNAHVVVGVGNIYASEALFLAGIRPGRAAGRVTRKEYARLADAIKNVLQRAIAEGGTTLRDFTQPDGNTGYFRIHLNVYGREGEPCRQCATPVKHRVMGQRATYWCPQCQQ